MTVVAYGAVCALLVCAGVIDARERRLPNGLALIFCAVAAIGCLFCEGSAALVRHVFCAFVICTALVLLEVVWRRRGTPGQGMGDIKALCALMLIAPLPAVISYAVALLLLAAVGALRQVNTLPLLPFLAVTFPLVLLACSI